MKRATVKKVNIAVSLTMLILLGVFFYVLFGKPQVKEKDFTNEYAGIFEDNYLEWDDLGNISLNRFNEVISQTNLGEKASLIKNRKGMALFKGISTGYYLVTMREDNTLNYMKLIDSSEGIMDISLSNEGVYFLFDGKIIFKGTDGKTNEIKINSKYYKIEADNDNIYGITNNTLEILNKTDGTLLDKIELGGKVTNIVSSDNKIALLSSFGAEVNKSVLIILNTQTNLVEEILEENNQTKLISIDDNFIYLLDSSLYQINLTNYQSSLIKETLTNEFSMLNENIIFIQDGKLQIKKINSELKWDKTLKNTIVGATFF